MKIKRKICVVGAGTWGTALANMLANDGHLVSLWSRDISQVEQLNKSHIHPYLNKAIINDQIYITNDLEKALNSSEIIVLAVPSIAIREITNKIKPLIHPQQIIVNVSKGLEEKTLLTMSEVIEDVLGNDFNVVSLSGPTHAEEVAVGLPTLIVSACKNNEIAKIIQDTFSNKTMRVYTNSDVKGVELAGAFKNIIALACGMSDGLGYGDNAKAALITRGLVEITRMGVALGCNSDTFSGLTGIGDIVVTATSVHSRNHKAGYLLGKGLSLEETNKEVGMVIEGLNALKAAKELENKYHIELPIINCVCKIVYEDMPVNNAVNNLFAREKKDETLYQESDILN